MKKINRLLLVIGTFVSTIAFAQQNSITLNPSAAKTIINKNIYGHFAEHLGRCIYDGFYVGDTSKIANTNGVRNDIIEALKKLKIPNLRWPGGCFADTYHWKDGIGDKSKRPTMVNTNWGDVVEDNSFGTHDFLNLCKLLDCEPYVAGNVGSGTIQELADWVQYVNGKSKSPMSLLRQQNGQTEPWNVTYWGIGNECYGCGGHMSPQHYADEYKQFVTFMPGQSKLFKVASGAKSENYYWTETIMQNIPLYMLDGVAMHHYSLIDTTHTFLGPSTSFTMQQYFTTMKSALWMEELVTKHSAVMDKYDPKKKVALVVDEWGGWYDVEPGTNPAFLYQQNTMRDALIAGTTLNTFNNHADRVRMANLAQCVNVLQAVILTDKEKMIVTPTYYVMEMYNVHQNATLIPLKIGGNNYINGDKKLPAITASASKDSLGITHISLTNIDPLKEQKVTVDLNGAVYKTLSGTMLTSKALRDFNSFDMPDLIKPQPFNGYKLATQTLVITMPPHSVVVLEMK